jgi:hypothetical protein
MATQTQLNKIMKLQQQADVKKLMGDGESKMQGKKMQQSAPKISALQNIDSEDKAVRSFFQDNDANDTEQFKSELTRFTNSKPIWKGRRSFFTRFLNEVPDTLYVKFSQLYLNQALNFKEFFDNVFKPKYIDNLFTYGKFDEVMRGLLQEYIANPIKYSEKSEKVKKGASKQIVDMIDSFNELEKSEKRYFVQKYLDNSMYYDEFYMRFKAGTLDQEPGTVEEPAKVQEETGKNIRHLPLMLDEDGNVIPLATGYNLYKFQRPLNRLPIMSSNTDFYQSLDKITGITGEMVDLAKIELKTNLQLSSSDIDDILIGLLEKYDSFEPFVKKLGQIIFYYVNQFFIRNQNNRVASLYKDRIQKGIFKLKGIAYAKKSDFLPELFEFDDDSNSESRNLVKKIIKKQLEIFFKNFKIKLHAIVNTSAKIKNIHLSVSDIVILSDSDNTDYNIFGYYDNGRKYLNIKQVDLTLLPSKLAKHIEKIYDTEYDTDIPVGIAVSETKEEVGEQFNIEELYNEFVLSLKSLNVDEELFHEATSDTTSETTSETKSDAIDSPKRNSCICETCGSKSDLSLKTKIKDGNQYKTICFCSFKCFEKYRN